MTNVCRVATQYGKNKRTMESDWVLEKDLEQYKQEKITEYRNMGWNKEINFHLWKTLNGTPFFKINENDIAWYWVVNRYNH